MVSITSGKPSFPQLKTEGFDPDFDPEPKKANSTQWKIHWISRHFDVKIRSLCAVFSTISACFPMRHPHNPKAVGSNPAPATKSPLISQEISGFSLLSELFEDVFSGVWWGDPNGDPYGSEMVIW